MQFIAQELLYRSVGLRHRGQVRLGVDDEVDGAEPGHCQDVCGISQEQGNVEVASRDIRHVRRLSVGAVYSVSVLETIAGLPVHPLIVHAAVVLVPLAAIGAVLMAASVRFSKRFGVVVSITAVVGAVASMLARISGGTLALQVEASQEHMDLGHQMPIASIALAVLTVVVWLFDRGIPGNRRRPWWLVLLVVLLAVTAVVATYLTVMTGHSGAESVWMGR